MSYRTSFRGLLRPIKFLETGTSLCLFQVKTTFGNPCGNLAALLVRRSVFRSPSFSPLLALCRLWISFQCHSPRFQNEGQSPDKGELERTTAEPPSNLVLVPAPTSPLPVSGYCRSLISMCVLWLTDLGPRTILPFRYAL